MSDKFDRLISKITGRNFELEVSNLNIYLPHRNLFSQQIA